MIRYDETKLGTLAIKQDDKRYNIDIRTGNCLAVFVHIRKLEGKKYRHALYSFFANEKHLKNIIKEYGRPFGDDVTKVKLNAFYKESFVLAKHFAKVGYKVELYYKEEK